MVQSRMRWRLSMGAQEMCGVRIQFFGLQEGIVAADGLGGDDVERGGGDLAAVQRVGQILLGHELPAGVVDEDHAVFLSWRCSPCR